MADETPTISNQKTPSDERLDGAFWRITAALACLMLASSLMNMVVFPLFDPIYTYARDISVTANAAALMILGAVAMFRPRFVRVRACNIVTLACLVVGPVLLIPALQTNNPALLIVASSLAAIGRAGVVILLGLSASRFHVRSASYCVTAAFTFSYALTALAWVLPIWMSTMLFMVLPLVSCGLVFQLAQPLFRQTAAAEAPADIVITRPSTFLPLASQLFVCLFLFRMAFGYSLRYGETGGVPVSDFLVLIPVAAIGLYVWIRRRPIDADLLAQVSVVLVVAGFFLVAANSRSLFVASNVLLSAGNTIFDMVAWVVLVVLAGRNRFGALVVFAWGRGVSGFGTLVGAALGVWSNDLFSANRDLLTLVSGALLVLFVAYALIGLKNFSFRDTISGVVSAQPATEAATNPEAEFDARCDEIAAQFSLSPRELEIFRMLARGRDRTYIEEKLVISRNTVKAHVKHIYAKLGIHSHQDLIALVQGE